MNPANDLEQKLKDDPIKLPSSVFIDTIKRFGMDELVAMGVNLVGTVAMQYALNDGGLGLLGGPENKALRDKILSITGPIVEKAGFFPTHFVNAFRKHKKTPEDKREKLRKYMKDAVKEGSKSLAEDILVHDPIYIGLMYAGLNAFPEIPAWAMSIASFGIAIGCVAALETGVNEGTYWLFQRSMKKAGFQKEKYLESRFFIDKSVDQSTLINKISKEFNLNNAHIENYQDVYFKHSLKHYSNRFPVVRVRNRTGDDYSKQSLQFVYTRTSEMKKKIEQFRYFVCDKMKLFYPIDYDIKGDLLNIKDDKIQKVLGKYVTDKEHKFSFDRISTNDKELLATADCLNKDTSFYVLELKTYRDKELLKESMKYVMKNFPVLQTTYNKIQVVREMHE